MKPHHKGTAVVTGVSSFIGYHLARSFSKAGYRVIGTISRPLASYQSFRLRRLLKLVTADIELLPLDLTKSPELAQFIRTVTPSLWVQHAGWATAYGSFAYDLAEGYRVNVAPLSELYAGLAAEGCGGVLLTGSSAEYSDTSDACKEEDPCWPTTPYGLSKLTETVRARQLAAKFGVPTRVARVFIPYGPMDQPSKLIPTVAGGLLSGTRVSLSPCEQQRDFVHVEDLAKGYVKLAEDLPRTGFDLFNLSSGRAVALRDVLLKLSEIAGADPAQLGFGDIAMRPGEAPVSYGSADKAQKLLQWAPGPLEEGLQAYWTSVLSGESI